MKCRSGLHEWLDPASAQRCCDPGWRRELRYGFNRLPGDADDGAVPIRGTGWRWVWHRLAADEPQDVSPNAA
ncbi:MULTISPECIES: hypothetical protein [Tepidimonas]|jgi:hypothetical protein|uniref:Uncharacterized protein n=2 Tax=Tepidimonas TaxID=114248 RepID=A0A554XB97_9BURK|nr:MULTISPECIES: hypothetical protein [Tepidimonas]MCX8018590.1 hypothetical protein [Rhodocyclaceae bacterium]TCS98773.1 hypothetical protein EDC36_104197 [Tepidimonas ignava]TSE20301.1 hypothetical protein Tigna_01932 [Tepidimonas ignava]TSE33049.1 hypothetical protein Tchar_01930 [Tepidimonas charontis]